MLKLNFYWIFWLLLTQTCLFAQKEMNIPPPLPVEDINTGKPICVYKPSDKKRQTTFPFSKADTIKIFSYPANMKINSNIIRTTIVNPYIKVTEIKETIILNEAQTDSLFSIFYDFKHQGGPLEKLFCTYLPRHCIVFYQGEEVLAFFEICLQCAQMRPSPNVDFGEFCSDKLCKFKKFFKQIGIQYEIHSEYCP